MKKKNEKKEGFSFVKIKFNTLELMLMFIMAFMFGVLCDHYVFNNDSIVSSFSLESNSETSEIAEVYNTILEEYIDKVDRTTLKEAAINGMVSSLEDKHSIYFDETETEQFQEELNGYFTGLGVTVYKDKEKNSLVTISDVFKNSPAEKAGLQAKDQFLKINGKDVTKYSPSDVSKAVKGKEGTFIIVIKRDNEEKEIKVTTGKVDLPSVDSKIITKNNKKIGYLSISVFATNTSNQVKDALDELNKDNISDLIVDLRYNPGGELNSVIDVASQFLDKGVPVIQIKKKTETDIRTSLGRKNKSYNLIVLINKSSASGAEALAGALSEQAGATLIGTSTYGKGTVQKSKRLPNGSTIKYTVETWSTSKGNSIEGKGIKPTIEVKQSDKYYATLKDGDDTQLQKALDLISK